MGIEEMTDAGCPSETVFPKVLSCNALRHTGRGWGVSDAQPKCKLQERARPLGRGQKLGLRRLRGGFVAVPLSASESSKGGCSKVRKLSSLPN